MKKQNLTKGSSRLLFLTLMLAGIFLSSNAYAQWSPSALLAFGLPNSSIIGILSSLLIWLLLILGIVAIIAFIISGLLYLTAAGDETQATRAKKAMNYAIIGIIVGMSGAIAVRAAYTALQAMPVF